MRTDLFTPNSRYYNTPTATLAARDGTTIVYLRRRFVPQPDDFVTVLEHVVIEGERLDNITAQYLDDPEQFWRICDANNAMEPGELTEIPGRIIRITLPQGIPAQPGV
jgi:hypothetical protein